MAGLSGLDVSEFSDLNRVARWYITLRWIAVFGVVLVLVASPIVWFKPLPLGFLLAVCAALACVNGLYHWYFRIARGGRLSQSELGFFFEVQVLSDYLFLSLLIYSTGFLENPCLFFFVFHILLAAYLFNARVVWTYVAILLAIVLLGSVFDYLGLLPHFSLYGDSFESYKAKMLPRLFGFCSTIVIAGYLGANINRRLKDTTLGVEVELNRYKSLDKIKSNFILQVTHELRGPLAAVRGYHEMMERGITGPLQPRTVEVLGKATLRLDGLLLMIDEMLDYAYMETDDKKRFVPTQLPVREVMEANIEAQATAVAEKDMRIELSCPAGLSLHANRDLLNIILSNLLSNALRYSPRGSVIRVSALMEGTELMFEVKDEGIGMSAEELEHIFEEFYRTRKAQEVERTGTGLGLSIIQKAVERLGGRIAVSSEVGKGSSFHIYLPKEAYNGREGSDNR